jgi:hypothetical protein
VTQPITIDPKTGLPDAFESAARLGQAHKVFAVLLTKRDASRGHVSMWLCILERTRGRKRGRGSRGKRRWREWWKPIHHVGNALFWSDTGTVHNDTFRRMDSMHVPVLREDGLPDNVHILWDDASA